MYQKLSENILFKSLDAERVEYLLSQIKYNVRKVNKDDIVGLSGEALNGIKLLLSGSVRAEMLDYSGRAITIENLEAPNLLAPAFLFGPNAKLPVDIISKGETEILFISKKSFLQLMQLDENVLANFLNVVSGRTQFLAQKINFLSFKTIREKYLHFILTKYKESGLKKFSLDQTQGQLAEFFGVSRPALAKVIAELNEENVIRTKGRYVEIINI